jgi:hypothetical protein
MSGLESARRRFMKPLRAGTWGEQGWPTSLAR